MNPSSAIDTLHSRLDQLTEVGRLLARERNSERLLEQLLMAAIKLANSDGGTLYRVSEDEKSLEFKVAINHSLDMHVGGSSGNAIKLPPIVLYDQQGNPNLHAAAAYCGVRKESLNIVDAYNDPNFDFTGAKAFDQANHYRTRSLLVIPLLDNESNLLGVLQLINARDQDGTNTAFDREDQLIVEAVAAQAGIALENKVLLDQMENLFRGFIELLNSAIDEKSEHTSGHCRRVPDITMMIAEAAHETAYGPLASFKMTDRDRRELHYAGLLHDCGKITTPVHVIDKSTKLITLFDRVALINTRFEVLMRDAKIEMLQTQLDGGDVQAAQQKYEQLVRLYEQEREFVAQCNIGSESMRQEDIDRVNVIAKHQFVENGSMRPLLDFDEQLNLTIRYGTLTDRERAIINNHITLSIRMLNSLPWPRDLRNVPEYAGGHHERMDGKGYPNKLRGEQMSVQSRLMALADVFEALTADDRPYKKAKTLSESMGIMLKMSTSGHLDPYLFRAFVEKQVHHRYAQTNLKPANIDYVDDAAILRKLNEYIAQMEATKEPIALPTSTPS